MKTLSIFLFAPIVLTFTMNSFSQSLADVARKERERQKTTHSTVVVTGVGRGASVAEAPASKDAAKTAPDAGSSTKPARLTDNKGRDESVWRAAFQQAREDLKRAEARVEVLDLRMKGLNTQLQQNNDLYNRENRIGAEMTATQKELDDAKRDVEQARKKIADLEEELRKSGGPPGWAR